MSPCCMTQNYHVKKKQPSQSHGHSMTTGIKKKKRQRGWPDAFFLAAAAAGPLTPSAEEFG